LQKPLCNPKCNGLNPILVCVGRRCLLLKVSWNGKEE